MERCVKQEKKTEHKSSCSKLVTSLQLVRTRVGLGIGLTGDSLCHDVSHFTAG